MFQLFGLEHVGLLGWILIVVSDMATRLYDAWQHQEPVPATIYRHPDPAAPTKRGQFGNALCPDLRS